MADFAEPVELLSRIDEGEDETFIFGPIDVFGESPIDIGSLLTVRFKDDNDSNDDDIICRLNARYPYDEARSVGEL